MPLNDAHCHFFSSSFFAALARQRGRIPVETPADLSRELGWDDPGAASDLAERWIRELDASSVARAALIASAPGDEESVATAVARYPNRFVGFFMLDPSAADAVERTRRATATMGLHGVCLFPAMHRVSLDDDRTMRVVEAAAETQGTAIFVHCGMLSIGVRRRLSLPSPFDLRLGDPLAVARLAAGYPQMPFIIPHFGAGLFRETLMAADTAANIYLDTSSSNSWTRFSPGLTMGQVFTSALAVAGPSRLLFGTDSSFYPRGWQRGIYEQQAAILSELALDESAQAQILGGNFDRLFS